MRTLIINFKAYREAFAKGHEIAEYAAALSKKSGVSIIIAPPFTMLKELNGTVKTIAQGMDEEDPGAFTAHITWFELKNSGISGTLLNHSEERYSYSKGGDIAYGELKEAVDKCASAGLETYVCVQNLEEAAEVSKMNPTAIAYEPPELIGGEVSVSTSKPEVVREFCDNVKNSSHSLALIGAGIKGKGDAEKSVELGSDGLLVSSGILKADDYKKLMDELVDGLNK